MSYRLILPGFFWIGFMLLFFIGAQKNDCELWLECIPTYAIFNTFLFLGFTHIWIGIFRKQLRYEKLRKRPVKTTFLASVVFALISELIIHFIGTREFSFIYLGLDVCGSILGIGTFKLLYYRCL